jgi:hypothetical protein
MATHRFNVELWANTAGTVPETKIMKTVSAVDRDDAIRQARELVASENPEINHMLIDTWIVEQLLD